MPQTAHVEARIAQILSTRLHLDLPSVKMDLFETGTLDSLAFVEFLLHLEREFGFRVALEDLELDNFRTIRQIAHFVVAQSDQTPGAIGRDGAGPAARSG